jgi:hypothetical protein
MYSMMTEGRFSLTRICKLLTSIGNTLTVLGCLGMVLGVLHVFDLDVFSFGLSSGIRIIGTVAIGGCLLSAIGYGISDHVNK